MSRTQKEKVVVSEDEGENVTSQESASSNDEESPKHGSISPLKEENNEATQKKYLKSTTDCEGYTEGLSSSPESERGTSPIPPSEIQVNLLESTRTRKNPPSEKKQYKFLKPYLAKMEQRNRRFNWYKKFGETSTQKPVMIEDLPCKCDLEEGWENKEQKQTKQESAAEISNSPVKSPFRLLAEHNSTCNARRVSLYFSSIVEYFIEEEVDPDIFLYTVPSSKDSVDYKYSILQENRKILLLKLKEGMRTKEEFWEEDMTENDEKWLERRNKVRITKHNVLKKLLKRLIKPYEDSKSTEENNDDGNNSNSNPSKESVDQIDQDKCRYLKVKDEYLELKKRFKNEAFERRHEELIDDAKSGGYFISYEEFLEGQKSKENKPSSSKDEPEIEKMVETEHADDEPENKRKKSDSEKETEELESVTEKGDSRDIGEPESKRKKVDPERDTEEPESEGKKGE